MLKRVLDDECPTVISDVRLSKRVNVGCASSTRPITVGVHLATYRLRVTLRGSTHKRVKQCHPPPPPTRAIFPDWTSYTRCDEAMQVSVERLIKHVYDTFSDQLDWHARALPWDLNCQKQHQLVVLKFRFRASVDELTFRTDVLVNASVQFNSPSLELLCFVKQ